ncbi:50S ribosomal protein L25 [Alkaliphilus crotonatoxidans]
MATPQIQAFKREMVGKNSVAKERKSGKVPAVVYSRGKDTQLIYLKERELEKLLSQYGTSLRLGLNFEDVTTFAIIKEIQRDNLKNQLLHLDLQTLNEHEKVRLTLPIYITNKEKVENSDRILQIQTPEIEIQTYPKYIPERVEVDAKLLLEKDNLTVSDLLLAANEYVEILTDKQAVIASLVYTTKLEQPVEEEI